jgi:hypothetical protein
MHDSNQQAVRFIEKEIKTYTALSLFLSKKRVRKQLGAGVNQALMSPTFYKERVKEAKKLIHELKKSD